MNSLTIPIQDPAFENLKRSGRLLHFVAATIILVNAFTHLREPGRSAVFFWTQLIVAADIFILLLAGSQVLAEAPRFNLFFRLVEAVFFFGVSLHMLVNGYLIISLVQFLMAVGYFYILYCENKSRLHETVGFHHLGITVPDFPGTKMLHWVHISSVYSRDREIEITTSFGKTYHLKLERAISWEEQIEMEEFCRHYVKG
jgi:hypothetical protein